ncbi:MAG: hypothetical protein GWN07_04055, partial [Actinobacteria bacterium]|nr:hypothetical protein [Actinomycetota bacterium]NIV85861.1 hypothetical protein [Actinomycetota bacterium]NIW26827.1 hypothetical protein [Actinomycetota bacterium]NIX19050.1 hypothetical protein [Actinomycetota bacterium]
MRTVMCPHVSHSGASPIMSPRAAWTDSVWVDVDVAPEGSVAAAVAVAGAAVFTEPFVCPLP